MNALEAMVLLQKSPRDDKPSRVNPNLTRKMMVEIIEKPLLKGSKRSFNYDGVTLTEIYEKRVHQVYKDQINPRY